MSLLTEEISALEADRAGLLAPDRVERIATEKLGYVSVRDEQIRTKDGGDTGNDAP